MALSLRPRRQAAAPATLTADERAAAAEQAIAKARAELVDLEEDERAAVSDLAFQGVGGAAARSTSTDGPSLHSVRQRREELRAQIHGLIGLIIQAKRDRILEMQGVTALEDRKAQDEINAAGERLRAARDEQMSAERNFNLIQSRKMQIESMRSRLVERLAEFDRNGAAEIWRNFGGET